MRSNEVHEGIDTSRQNRRLDHERAVQEGLDSPGRFEWVRYEPRMQRVIHHVHDHLDEPLALNVLADLACLSPHHWHRVYHAMYGETLAHTVKRLRLHRAAGQLACSATPVAAVAAAAGYPSVASFTGTFKSIYGLPPARFRAEGQHREFELQPDVAHTPAFEVSVLHTEAVPVLAVEHRGSYMAFGRAFDLLFTRVAAAGLARPGGRGILEQPARDRAARPAHAHSTAFAGRRQPDMSAKPRKNPGPSACRRQGAPDQACPDRHCRHAGRADHAGAHRAEGRRFLSARCRKAQP